MRTKLKPYTPKQLSKIATKQEMKIEGILELLSHIVKDTPAYSGGLRVRISYETRAEDYFMVTDLVVQDPFLEFYHLVPADLDSKEPLSLASFPKKPAKQKTETYVRSLEKDAKWNRVFEQVSVPTIWGVQTLGHFTYNKFWSNADNKATIPIPDGIILPFNKE